MCRLLQSNMLTRMFHFRVFVLLLILLSLLSRKSSASLDLRSGTDASSSSTTDTNVGIHAQGEDVTTSKLTINYLAGGLEAPRFLRSVNGDIRRVLVESAAEKEIDEHVTARMIVHYRTDNGRKSILTAAKKVIHDFKKDQFLAVEVDAKTLELLASDTINIGVIEPDGELSEQGKLEKVMTVADMEKYYETKRAQSPQKVKQGQRGLYLDYLQKEEKIPYGIKMTQAHKLDIGDKQDVMVCIVDTGADSRNPDLDSLGGSDRYSYVDSSYLHWNDDERGHGTHIAGTVSAKANNDFGTRGMGAIKTYITRGLNDAGKARESDVVEAMEQCENAGAKVISLSLAGESMSRPMKEIIDRLYEKNVMVVAAAGNDGTYCTRYPAAYEKVVSVTAVDENGKKWSDANWGPWVELSAPGHMILSTGLCSGTEHTFAFYSGTSMAVPHVAAAAALLMSHFPECTVTQIRYALAYNADDQGKYGCDDKYGYGIVKVRNAYDFLCTHPCQNAKWGQDIGSGQCDILDQRPNA